jgi:hypothetical protein
MLIVVSLCVLTCRAHLPRTSSSITVELNRRSLGQMRKKVTFMDLGDSDYDHGVEELDLELKL